MRYAISSCNNASKALNCITCVHDNAPPNASVGWTIALRGAGPHTRLQTAQVPGPWPEHPQPPQYLAEHEIHAKHLEAFNYALRRRTNTYANTQLKLQCRLDVYWILHDFVRRHFTTKQVPAVALGLLDADLSWADLFRIHHVRRLSDPI
jgi:hypothetical protein